MEYSVSAVGSLDAFERVAVTARVAGAVERVMFSEGQVVGKGTNLVEIDPEPLPPSRAPLLPRREVGRIHAERDQRQQRAGEAGRA